MTLSIEDIKLTCKNQQIETKKDFIKTLEDTLITCDNFENREINNKSSINLQMLILRFMLYRYKTTEHKKAKGVSKAVVKKVISFNDYKNTLKTEHSLVVDVVSIRSVNQQLFTSKK
jgi:hypothetical protein